MIGNFLHDMSIKITTFSLVTKSAKMPSTVLDIHVLVLVEGNPDSKIHGANMGPTWVLSAPGRPHVGPMNLANRVYYGCLRDFSSKESHGIPIYVYSSSRYLSTLRVKNLPDQLQLLRKPMSNIVFLQPIQCERFVYIKCDIIFPNLYVSIFWTVCRILFFILRISLRKKIYVFLQILY